MERKRTEAAIALLKELWKKLFSEDISTARLAGFQLARMQEDGLALLKQALFSECSQNAKKAAAYGLRSMRGRMRRMAVEVLEQGVISQDRLTKAVCVKSLGIMRGISPEKGKPRSVQKPGKRRIQTLPGQNSADPLHRKRTLRKE